MARLDELQIELCGVCNAHCTYCTWEKRSVGKQMMDYGLAERLVREAKDLRIGLVTFHGVGEATLHKKLPDLLQLAEDLGLSTRLSTNCYTLKGALADKLRQFRNLQLILAIPFTEKPDFVDRCFTNAISYVDGGYENRSVHALMVCSTDAKSPSNRIAEGFSQFRGKPNFNIHFKQPVTWPNDEPQKGFLPPYANDELFIVEPVSPNTSIGFGCSLPHRFLMVLADGTVVPCCVGMDDWGLGTIGGRTLKEVWESIQMASLRRKFDALDDTIPCGHCKKRTDCLQ